MTNVAIVVACVLTMIVLYVNYYYLLSNVSTAPSAVVLVPVIESISPDHGPEAGGTEVTLTGQYFSTDCIVYFGDELATDIVRINSETVTCVSPASTTGTVAVSVKIVNDDDQAYTKSESFTYE
jgi:hypothetical protein